MRIVLALVRCAAMASALRSTPALSPRHAPNRAQRTQMPLAQNGWAKGFDEATGSTFWYNLQTGQSQRQPPPQTKAVSQGFGVPVVWRFVPAWGVHSEYQIRNGEEQVGYLQVSRKHVHTHAVRSPCTSEHAQRACLFHQVLGRFDMVEQKDTVSRAQCLVRVNADGSAALFSLGKVCPVSLSQCLLLLIAVLSPRFIAAHGATCSSFGSMVWAGDGRHRHDDERACSHPWRASRPGHRLWRELWLARHAAAVACHMAIHPIHPIHPTCMRKCINPL